MRVTKLIRAYVEKTVAEKMPYGEPSEQYKEQNKALHDLTEHLNEKVNQYAQELLADIPNLPEDFKIYRSHFCTFQCDSYNSPMNLAARKHEREIINKRANVVEHILLELELGATKADLERIIGEAVNK